MRKVGIKILILILLSISGLVIAQTGTFQLGFSGTYPNYYLSSTYATNWNYYNEMNMNLWQGWWVGDTAVSVLNALNTNNINGYFQPDTLRWVGYGRMQVDYAWHGRDERFKYNGVSQCGVQYQDNTWNNGKTVLYFNASDSNCNQQGLALYNVYQNAFQSLTGLVGDPMFLIEFPNGWGQVVNTYYVKPRIRISVADAFSDPPKNVCKVIVKAFDGSTIDEVTITTANFRDAAGSNYNGQYLEDYYQCPISVSGYTLNQGRSLWNWSGDLLDQCHVDYQIYWFGTVSFYIDYVKVMDEAAQELFGTRPQDILIKNRLKDKIARLKSNDVGHKLEGFYMEEVDFSNISCIKLLNDSLLPAWSANDPNYKMIPLINPNSFMQHIRNRDWGYFWNYFDSINVPYFLTSDNLYTSLIDSTRQSLSELPSNLSTTLVFPSYYSQNIKNEIQNLYDAGTNFVSVDDYNSYLQTRLDIMEGYLKGLFYPSCHEHNVNLVAVPSVSLWHYHTSNFLNREPMTSEIAVQFGIEICDGAKGIFPFAYESWISNYFDNPRIFRGFPTQGGTSGRTDFHYDMSLGASDFDADSTWGWRKRVLDVYGENKWDSLKALYLKLKVLGPYLVSSINTTGYSIASDGADHNFIKDIQSIDPALKRTNLYNSHNSQITGCDLTDQRYWEMGILNIPNQMDHSKYVLFCNRRCTPAIGGYHGDNRVLKIRFNTSYMPEATNWQLKDVYTGQSMQFVLDYNNYLDLGSNNSSIGWFNPGETKLFRLAPVIQTGGTLAGNDTINGEFNCLDTVFNNGYSIIIKNGSSIHFADTSTIVMNGGTFTAGDVNLGTQNIIFNAINNNHFHGLQFQNCNVELYNSNFTNLSNDTTFSLTCIDCPQIDIRHNNFTYTNQKLNGAINIAYYNDSFPYPNVYIGSNTFNSGISTLPSINAMSYGAIIIPMIIEFNIFNGNMTSGSSGIILSNIIGGAIKTNTFLDCDKSISALSSSLDIASNIITSDLNCSNSIQGFSGSELRMTRTEGYFLGGLNKIKNTGSRSNNIFLDNSYFIMDQGQNVFNIFDSLSRHMNGYFPLTSGIPTTETYNCFEYNNMKVDPPFENITWGQDSVVSFIFDPYMPNCAQDGVGGEMVINLGNGIYDSIPTYIRTGKRTPVGQRYASDLQSAKTLYDSISIQMRYRNYNYVKTKCMDLINTYPDSIQSLNSISKLYLAVLASDTSRSGRLALKTYYEKLVLNYGYNLSLVDRCNYYIQKCKVLLHQYNDALAGFQAIINNNPYSYEGLIAKWDYMAISLLIQGEGGGERILDFRFKNYDLENSNVDLNKLNEDYLNKEYPENDGVGDPQGPREGSPWTKQEKKSIKQAINKSFESIRIYQESKIKALTKEAETGNENARNQLILAQTIKDIVKPIKPKNIQEHIRIVNTDIQKLTFSIPCNENKTKGFIPTSFVLYQNFPNPFNPVTKIMYDIPKDSKVKITVYDILGREVIKLVNNEFKQAGRYYVEFNGNNFASGVYFYKIEAGNFIQAKKMVLVK